MLATGTRYAIVGVQLQENELDYWLIVAIGGTSHRVASADGPIRAVAEIKTVRNVERDVADRDGNRPGGLTVRGNRSRPDEMPASMQLKRRPVNDDRPFAVYEAVVFGREHSNRIANCA